MTKRHKSARREDDADDGGVGLARIPRPPYLTSHSRRKEPGGVAASRCDAGRASRRPHQITIFRGRPGVAAVKGQTNAAPPAHSPTATRTPLSPAAVSAGKASPGVDPWVDPAVRRCVDAPLRGTQRGSLTTWTRTRPARTAQQQQQQPLSACTRRLWPRPLPSRPVEVRVCVSSFVARRACGAFLGVARTPLREGEGARRRALKLRERAEEPTKKNKKKTQCRTAYPASRRKGQGRHLLHDLPSGRE